MNRELELVESMDKLSVFMDKFQKRILSGDLKNFTLRQLYYIELINKHENIRISEIAKMLNVKKSTVSIAINQLIEQGFVSKVQSDTDKRVYFLKLTSKGKNIIKIHIKVHKNMINQISEVLSHEEVESFIKTIDKITKS